MSTQLHHGPYQNSANNGEFVAVGKAANGQQREGAQLSSGGGFGAEDALEARARELDAD